MKVNIIEKKHYNVPDSLKEVIKKKFKKLDKYFDDSTDVKVVLSAEKDISIMESTIYYKGIIIRAEERNRDIYATVDEVIKKIQKQIHHQKSKLEKRLRKGAFENNNYSDEEVLQSQQTVVRRKNFELKPSTVEEAIMQMNLLGHNFYVFTNSENNKVCVIYKRNDGQIGLLEPEY